MTKVVPLLVLGACSYTFDGGPRDLPLVGSPPPLNTLEKLNRSPVVSATVIAGVDDAYWVGIEEVNPHPDDKHHMRLVRLSPPAAEETAVADGILTSGGALYLIDYHLGPQMGEVTMDHTTVTVRSPAEVGEARTFAVPDGTVRTVLSGGSDDVFCYLVTDDGTTEYDLVRTDGSFRRKVPLPAGLKADNPRQFGEFRFNSDGSLFFDRDEDGVVRAHSTLEESDFEIGKLASPLLLDESRGQLISCDAKGGLRAAAIVADGAKDCDKSEPPFNLVKLQLSSSVRALRRCAITIDASACGPFFTFHDSDIYYFRGTQLWRAPLDGAGLPRQVAGLEGARLLAIGPDAQVIYSRDPASRYIYGVGDGWLGGWRFMERGRDTNFSRDQTRIRWLEHAAQPGGVGDLYSAPINGAPIRLARNVPNYYELGDGRLLAVADDAFLGPQNRIVLIDEKEGAAHWVVDQASGYRFVPGSSDLLVDIVTGATTSDLVRVPIPKKP